MFVIVLVSFVESVGDLVVMVIFIICVLLIILMVSVFIKSEVVLCFLVVKICFLVKFLGFFCGRNGKVLIILVFSLLNRLGFLLIGINFLLL